MPRVLAYRRHPRRPNRRLRGSKAFSRDVIVEEAGNLLQLRNRITALVVDNSISIQLYHTALLSRFGVDNRAVENGQQVVDLYCNGASFDLILMDNFMPVVNGRQATRTLRAMGVRSMIVGVSSVFREDERQEFIDAGLDDFQEKPLTCAKLIHILRELESSLSF
ncbi:hypothetical protein NE237_009321 [Protea cynaroides]|uniref:Response regulatory domain-containing protein n=1 Tax=Protea cynaroides TaxID=273540 RepID=A0A9Q0KY41_9MAGN|nr:hypothetical protein NE237_009321 [Protea cynaroides]